MTNRLMELSWDIDPNRWRLFATRREDERFKPFQKRIWMRDHYTCQFCGFQSALYMEVVNLDGNYFHNNMDNMVTACPLCTQCQFLEMANQTDYGGGTMVYLPEMGQAELNALCHVLFCATVGATDYMQAAQDIYNNLRLRAQVVEDQLGKGLSSPKMFAQMVIDTPLENRDAVVAHLQRGIRCLPSKNKFTKQVEAWTDQALTHMEGVS